MSLFSAVFDAVVDTAMLPVAIVKDVVTIGGVATDQDKPYTAQQIEKISDDLKNENIEK